MKIAGHPQDRLRMGLAQHHGASQTRQHLAQPKTSVETVGRLGQIAPGVLTLADGVIAPADRAFDVTRAGQPTFSSTPCCLRPWLA